MKAVKSDRGSNKGAWQINVKAGRLEGRSREGVWEFMGIPYARPPRGTMRWKPPVSVEPWGGVKPCQDFAQSCAQPGGENYQLGKLGEDCLYLNVWVPGEMREHRLPVMVWMHGGAFLTGSASLQMRPGVRLYDGSKLARRGVIVITINYRLGPFGFLAHPLLDAESPRHVSGNYGLLDQIAALEWVAENISAFGGDPSRVTLFGQSAGATSIYLLMVSPLAGRLFKRAICQSGPFWVRLGLPPAYQDIAAAERTGLELAQRLGVTNSPDHLAAMRACPQEEILRASDLESGLTRDSLDFVPVVDGWALPERPEVLYLQSKQHRVDVIAGWTQREADYFMNLYDMSMDEYESYLRELGGSYAARLRSYFEADSESMVKVFPRLITACEFEAPARFLAGRTLEAGCNAFLYLFTRVPPDPEGRPLCACHGSEIPYVFGEIEGEAYYGPEDHRLSRRILEYFTNFARTGDPAGDGLPAWPVYDSESVLELGDEITPVPVPDAEACDLVQAMHLESVTP